MHAPSIYLLSLTGLASATTISTPIRTTTDTPARGTVQTALIASNVAGEDPYTPSFNSLSHYTDATSPSSASSFPPTGFSTSTISTRRSTISGASSTSSSAGTTTSANAQPRLGSGSSGQIVFTAAGLLAGLAALFA